MRARGIGLAGPAGLAALTTMAAMTMAAVWLADVSVVAQAPAAAARSQGPRTADGKPDLNGIWQVLNSAHWNLEPHSPEEGVPGGQGVVEGGTIPYQPAALAKRQRELRTAAPPPTRCRSATCLASPASRTCRCPSRSSQTPKYVVMAYEFAHTRRIIYTDGSPHVEALEFWMGDSRGKWEGDTLVVSTNNFTDKTWFDKAGNFHSADAARRRAVHAERTRPHQLRGDPRGPEGVYTRPWKMSMIIYRAARTGHAATRLRLRELLLEAGAGRK